MDAKLTIETRAQRTQSAGASSLTTPFLKPEITYKSPERKIISDVLPKITEKSPQISIGESPSLFMEHLGSDKNNLKILRPSSAPKQRRFSSSLGALQESLKEEEEKKIKNQEDKGKVINIKMKKDNKQNIKTKTRSVSISARAPIKRYTNTNTNQKISQITHETQIHFIGFVAPGKSSILQKFISPNGTFGVLDKFSKQDKIIHIPNINGVEIPVLDTVSEEIEEIQKMKFPKLWVLVYSLTSKESFEKLQNFLTKSLEKSTKMNKTLPSIIVVGNKLDLVESLREVSEEEVEQLKNWSINIDYIEVSAKTGTNIQTLYKKIIMKI